MTVFQNRGRVERSHSRTLTIFISGCSVPCRATCTIRIAQRPPVVNRGLLWSRPRAPAGAGPAHPTRAGSAPSGPSRRRRGPQPAQKGAFPPRSAGAPQEAAGQDDRAGARPPPRRNAPHQPRRAEAGAGNNNAGFV